LDISYVNNNLQLDRLQWFKRGYASSTAVTIAFYMMIQKEDNGFSYPANATSGNEDKRFFISSPGFMDFLRQPTLTDVKSETKEKLIDGTAYRVNAKKKEKGIATLNGDPGVTTLNSLLSIFGGTRLSGGRTSSGRPRAQLDTAVKLVDQNGNDYRGRGELLKLYGSHIQTIISMNSYRMNAGEEGFFHFYNYISRSNNEAIKFYNTVAEQIESKEPSKLRENFHHALEQRIDAVIRSYNLDGENRHLAMNIDGITDDPNILAYVRAVKAYVDESKANAIRFWLALSYMVVKDFYEAVEEGKVTRKPLYYKETTFDNGRKSTVAKGLVNDEYLYLRTTNQNRRYLRGLEQKERERQLQQQQRQQLQQQRSQQRLQQQPLGQ